MPTTKQGIALRVNNRPYEAYVEARRTLADVLRDELGLTGTKLGCEHGVCGACTVLVDGRAVRACLMLAIQAEGTAVTTVEGLDTDGVLDSVQQAFTESHGLQCGFCTPGMLMTTHALLKDNPHPTEEEVKIGLSGNICRCTGYQNIIASVVAASRHGHGNGA